MKITHCKLNHLTHPMGYSMSSLRFSWLIEESTGTCQTDARIVISDIHGHICHDSGWQKTEIFTGIEVDWRPLPCTRYEWQIHVRTDAGEEAVSSPNWFETGKMGTPWRGHWITCAQTDRMPVFSKKLPVRPDLTSARLYICGLGMYEAYLTDKETTDIHVLTEECRVGSEVLSPGCNNYAQWIQYQTFDITESIRQRPVLHVWLGSGWYMSRFGFNSKPGDSGFYGESLRLIADIVLTYADGHTETVGTDESWQVWPSNITFTGIYDGEHADDTLPACQSVPAVLYDGVTAPLADRYSLPVLVQEVRRPAALLVTPAGEQVFDLGQNLSGSFTLRVRAGYGDRIHVQAGEVLQDGNFYNENLRTAKAEYEYISDGCERTVRPRFTFYGFRYLKVTGISDLSPDDLTALACYSDIEEIGTITTGHPKVNQLISNAHWGLKGNFLDVPTDCPQRDERMGWTGDAQVFSPTACFFRDTWHFYRKYLHDMDTEQQQLSGKVPIVVPSFGYHDTACVWGDAAVIIPWNLYLFYGDETILREQYGSMKGWVDYIHTFDGSDRKWGQVFHYGDWLALDSASSDPGACMGGTDEDYIAYVYYAHSADLVARAAGILGMDEDRAYYTQLRDELYDWIRREYFSASGRCCVNTQTGLIIALQYGIAPDRDAAVRQLSRTFARSKNRLQTGFVGTPLLCNVLTDCGMERLACDLLLYEGYPGWLYAVNLGATTIWERWNSLDPEGHISSTGMNSLNHYSYGSIAEWIFRHLAGLDPVEEAPGFKHVRICPVYDLRIGHVDMAYRSVAGTYRISWKLTGRRHVRLDLAIPFGCSANLELYGAPEDIPDRQYLKAGSYTFEYDCTIPLRRPLSAESKVFELLQDPEAAQILAQFGLTRETLPDTHDQDSLLQLTTTAEGHQDADTVRRIDALLKALQA